MIRVIELTKLFVWMQKNKSVQFSQNFLIKFILKHYDSGRGLILLSVFLYLPDATSAVYEWRQSHKPYGPFPSPSQACAAHQDYMQSVSAPNVKYFSPSVSLYRGIIFKCIVQKKIGDVNAPPTGSLISRFGDFCQEGTAYNHTTGACANDEQKGLPPPNGCALNPINISIGNKYQTENDYSGSSGSTLNFTRTYNSLDGLWRHSHSTYLRLAGTPVVKVALVMHHGRESFFTVSDNAVTATPTELGSLVKTAYGWLYSAENGERFTFDATGRLIRWANNSGAAQTLTYTNEMVTVTDHLGSSLTLTEDAQHQPLSLSVGDLQIAYSYNSNQRLIQLIRTRGGHSEQREFHYEDPRNPSLLTGITDERGVRYATWAYDDQGRAISSEHAGGIEHTDVVYNTDGSSTVTNELGKKTTYRFQAIDGIKRVSAIEGEPSAHCPMSNSTFTYDARGLLKTKTDNKDNLTTYTYNTRGQEISRTEAAGTPQARTVTTDWHPTLFLPVTVTEPARITTYTYDAQGRQLSQAQTDL